MIGSGSPSRRLNSRTAASGVATLRATAALPKTSRSPSAATTVGTVKRCDSNAMTSTRPARWIAPALNVVPMSIPRP